MAILATPAPTLTEVGPLGSISAAASRSAKDVFSALGLDAGTGLTADAVGRRRREYDPNSISSHRARLPTVLWHQVRSPLPGAFFAALIALMGGYLVLIEVGKRFF